jgi:vacuolar-type H+-ATPase catalytic subunit A/Vma1
MTNYENELDKIRIKLYEETSGMKKDEIVRIINTHAPKKQHKNLGYI